MDGAPTEWIRGCADAHAALLADIASLSDDQARAASRLPDWSVGHVLTHIARNADSVVWRLEGAAAGDLRDQYPGGLAQRSGDIAAGAGRPAEALVSDVRQSARALEQCMADLPEAAWDAPSRTSRGALETSREAVFSRWREVVVHHGDLGVRSVPLPDGVVDVWLPRELPLLEQRTERAELLAWLLGRGPAPDLRPW